MTSLRAAIAVALLLGFFVFAFGIVAGMFAVAVAAGHTAGLKIGALAVVVGAGVLRAVWQVVRNQSDPPAGVLLAPDRAPELFWHVGQLAQAGATRPPDEIRLVADVNAAVQEDTRLLGLRPGVRRMYIGVPLLTALNVDQMRAVLAHELGHYSHSHTRLAEVTYRGRATILRTAQNLRDQAVVRHLFLGYLRLYMLVSQAVSRRQELEADRAAVRVAGRDATASALREVEILAAAWRFYVGSYIGWGYEQGYFPDRVFGGFGELVAARAGELDAMRSEGPADTASRWDSHPSTADRIAAIAREPDVPRNPDPRRAGALLADFAGAAREVEAGGFNVGGRTVLPWEQFTAAAADAAFQKSVDTLYRGAARVAGLPTADLRVVLDLLAAGRAPELTAAVTRADWNDAAGRAEGQRALASLLDTAIQLAAVHSGAAFWRHSWSEPVSLVTRDGTPMDFSTVVERAVTDPASVGPLRAGLATLRIEESRSAQATVQATAETAEVVGAIADIRLDGEAHDLYILDEGLVFVRRNGRPALRGEARLHQLLSTVPAARIAAANRWLPFEDVAWVEVVKRLPATYRLTLHSGAALTVKVALNSDAIGNSAETLGKVLARHVRVRRGAPEQSGPGTK